MEVLITKGRVKRMNTYDLLPFPGVATVLRLAHENHLIVGLVSCRDTSMTSLQATSSAHMMEALLQSITDDPVSDALPDVFLDPQRGGAMERDLFVFGGPVGWA